MIGSSSLCGNLVITYILSFVATARSLMESVFNQPLFFFLLDSKCSISFLLAIIKAAGTAPSRRPSPPLPPPEDGRGGKTRRAVRLAAAKMTNTDAAAVTVSLLQLLELLKEQWRNTRAVTPSCHMFTLHSRRALA